MWELYSKGVNAVAIQSTFSKLVANLPTYVNVGLVRYIDYERQTFAKDNSFNAVMHKRKSFEHESEVRAIAWQTLSGELGGDVIRRDMTPTGLPIGVNLEALIELIYVHPFAPTWFSDIVRELVAKQELKIEVRQSMLGDSPLW